MPKGQHLRSYLGFQSSINQAVRSRRTDKKLHILNNTVIESQEDGLLIHRRKASEPQSWASLHPQGVPM